MTEPLFFETDFRRKGKKGKWPLVESPHLEAGVADTHCHLHLLPYPVFSLAKAGACNVKFLDMIVDSVEDDLSVLDQLSSWETAASITIRKLGKGRV